MLTIEEINSIRVVELDEKVVIKAADYKKLLTHAREVLVVNERLRGQVVGLEEDVAASNGQFKSRKETKT